MTILSVIATCLGIFLSVLNLVVFLKEKDRTHLRTALLIVTLGALLIGVVTMPSYAPGLAGQVARRLPPHPLVQRWLGQVPATAPAPLLVEGSFTPEWQHNLFGGISGLKLVFQFVSSTDLPVRVVSYRLTVEPSEGEGAQSFDRVLTEPVVVSSQGTARSEVVVDGEILDVFLKRMDAEHPGRVSVSWHALDAQGASLGFSANAGKF